MNYPLLSHHGKRLLDALSLPHSPGYCETATRLCRVAITYRKLQRSRRGAAIEGITPEKQAELDDKENVLEQRILRYAGRLPDIKRVEFSRDTSGATVQLVTADGRTSDGWGTSGGLGVPGS